jgi:hypothetical protein
MHHLVHAFVEDALPVQGAGAVDQQVHSPEAVQRSSDHRLDLGVVAHVDLDRQRLSAERLDLCGHRVNRAG